MNIPIASKENRVDKVLIYGNPGTGKTTSAWKYCQRKEYNPIVFDNNDTNFTDMPNLDVDFKKNHLSILQNMTRFIPHLKQAGYDTIVFEDIGNLFELLTPPSTQKNQLLAYKARSDNIKKLIGCLDKSGCNMIFIGQSDMIIADKVNKNDTENYSKPVVLINALVNFAYYTYKPDENTFEWTCTKYRNEQGILY